LADPQLLIAETELFQRSTLHVLDHNVRTGSKLFYLLQILWLFEVSGDRTLVTVDGQEVSRLAAREGRPPVAGIVAALGVLDLDHVRPEVPKHHRCVRPGQNPGEIQDPHAFEG
jgi:hypothetical protein